MIAALWVIVPHASNAAIRQLSLTRNPLGFSESRSETKGACSLISIPSVPRGVPPIESPYRIRQFLQHLTSIMIP